MFKFTRIAIGLKGDTGSVDSGCIYGCSGERIPGLPDRIRSTGFLATLCRCSWA